MLGKVLGRVVVGDMVGRRVQAWATARDLWKEENRGMFNQQHTRMYPGMTTANCRDRMTVRGSTEDQDAALHMSYGEPCGANSVSNCRQAEHLELPESARIPGHVLCSAAHQAGHHPSKRRYQWPQAFTLLFRPMRQLVHPGGVCACACVCTCLCVHACACVAVGL